jgi:phosphodiesterase/alkaline phosphatase D-like protein
MRTNNYYFKLLIAIILLVSINFNNAFAQVTITAPSAAVTACTGFPTNSGTLSNIVITEISNGDISGSGTLILTAPTNFEFTATGSASSTGTEITGLSSVLTNSTTITLAFTVGGTAEINALTISGVQIRGITGATSASTVTRTGGTSIINGDANGTIHATLTSTLSPTLSSTLTPAPICGGTIFNYVPSSSVAGTSFVWTRAVVSGILNSAGSGTGNPNETLINTTSNPINVTYVYTLSANGCTNPTTFSVVVTVDPTPTLSSTLTPPAICSSTIFSYTPASGTFGATFYWTRAVIVGISNPAGSGSGNPNEILNNTTAAPINVTYVYTVLANGCTNPSTYSVVTAVNPSAPVPNALAASNFTCTSFNANWAASTGAISYFLDISTDAGFTTFIGTYNNLNVGNITTYNVTGLTANETYYYRLRADNNCGTGLNSNTILAITGAPVAPNALSASNITCSSMNANWDAAAGASTYYLDVSTSVSFNTFLSSYNNLNVGNVLTYNVTGLTLNTTYYYRIRSGNSCTIGLNSNTQIVSTNAPMAPNALAPSNFTCTSMNANWASSTSAISYSLDVSTDAFNTFIGIYHNLNVGNVLTFNITGLNTTDTYSYRVRATNGCDTSLNSNTITINMGFPYPPSVLAASNLSCTSFSANWAATETNVVAYFLDVSTASGFTSFVSGYNNLNIGNVLTYDVTGLNSNTTYYYRFRTNSGCNTSAFSSAVSITTTAPITPNAPNALAASNLNCTSLNANWDALSGATGYFLDVSSDAGFTTFVAGYNNLNVNNVTTFNITGLAVNTNYYYRVRVTNGCNTSLNSNTITVNTSNTDAPIALAASNFTCTSLNANWGASTGALTYYLDVSTNPSFSTFVTGYNNLNVNNVTTYNITGLSINTTYYYRVRAVNSCSASLNSNTISVITAAPAAPVATPASNITCTSLNANWIASSGAINYYLDCSTDNTFTSFVQNFNNLSLGNTSTLNITGLSGGTYYYRLRADNGCTTSINSDTISVEINITPTPPTATAPTNVACASFTANWTAATGTNTYFLQVATDAFFSNFAPGYSNLNVGNVTTYNVVGLVSNTTYHYRLRAGNGCTVVGVSNAIVASTGTSGPTAPTATTAASITCTSINANWTASTDATNYYLDVATDAGFTGIVAGYNNLNIGNILSYNITGLLANTTYYYRVSAANSCGVSSNSNSISASTTSIAPTAPTALAATGISCTSFNANWAVSTGAIAYYLDVATDAGFTAFVAGYNNLNIGNVLTYNVTGLTVNITYYYRLRASNACATSSNSNSISATTTSSIVPNAPTASAATAITCTSMNVNWAASSGATTYFLDVATDAGFTAFVSGYNNLNVGNVLTYNVTGLIVNTTYYYRVRANNGCNTSTNSNSITIGTVEPTLSSTITPPAICSGSVFSYIPTSTTSGATFAWTRAVVAGISNAAGAGTGNPNETLTNTATSSINVTYVYTVAANGCTNSTSYSVVVVVNPSAIAPNALVASNYTFTSMNANWALSTGATVYFLDVSTDASFGSFVTGYNNLNVGNVLTYNITGLISNTIYYYRVRSGNGSCVSLNSNTTTVNDTDAIWPGDTNGDSLVNNVDLLPIGLYYSQTGAPRLVANNTFQADFGTDWGTTETNGQDIKHADCNGNGTIDNNDTLAINSNFNLTHAIVPVHTTNYNEIRTTADMYFVLSGSSFNAGDVVNAEVWLGTSTTPISSLYGISFNINFDASMVQTGTESIGYPSSWLGTPGTNAIKIGKTDELASTTYGAITRIDHANANGFGKIADFKFQIKTSLTSPAVMPLSICCIVANNATGVTQTITTQADSVLINQPTTGIQENSNASTISVSPNPFNSQTTISFSKKIKNGTIKIVDVVGKEVRNIEFSGNKLIIEKGELNAGIYFIQVSSENNIIANKKIIIQ